MSKKKSLFCFGLGFTTTTLGRVLLKQGWQVSGTTRNQEKARALREEGFDVLVLQDGSHQAISDELAAALRSVNYIINSTPPNEKGDIVVSIMQDMLTEHSIMPKWFGYLSTIGVYGEHHGAWIDESAKLYPVTKRSKWRRLAEQQWQDLAHSTGLPLQIFRLPGIYGAGRNQMVTLQKGKSRRLVKKGQVFNRIHVEDIAQIVIASMNNPQPGEIYNISDDMPCPPQDVVTFASELLGIEPPPIVQYEEAELTPMARSFYGECKRIRNEKIKKYLGISLKYPTYKEGLSALAKELKLD